MSATAQPGWHRTGAVPRKALVFDQLWQGHGHQCTGSVQAAPAATPLVLCRRYVQALQDC